MKAQTKTTGVRSAPRCWWCGIDTELDTGYRGTADELGLPAGSGVVVCTPACPKRPAGARVWQVRSPGNCSGCGLPMDTLSHGWGECS
jgi:hypothetical protein